MRPAWKAVSTITLMNSRFMFEYPQWKLDAVTECSFQAGRTCCCDTSYLLDLAN